MKTNKLINEYKQLKSIERVASNKHSRNTVYNSAANSNNTGGKHCFNSKRNSVAKLTQIDQNCNQNKRNKSKQKHKQEDISLKRHDFEILLESISNFNARLQAPSEIMESCKALYMENSVLHQAIGFYESEVEMELNEKIQTLLGEVRPDFTKREARLIQISDYWKDKTLILIEKYANIIKSLKDTVIKERKENVKELKLLKENA